MLTIAGIATAWKTMSKVAKPIILIKRSQYRNGDTSNVQRYINAIQRCGYQPETLYHIKEKILTRYN